MSYLMAHVCGGFGDLAGFNRAGFVATGTLAFDTSGGAFDDLGAINMDDAGNAVRLNLPVTATGGTSFVHFFLEMVSDTTKLGTGSQFFRIYNDSGNDLCLELLASAAGNLVAKNAAGTTVFTSDPSLLNYGAGTDQEFAVEAQIGNASGVLKIYVDGALVADLTGVDLVDSATGIGMDSCKWENAFSSGDSFTDLRLSQVIVYDGSNSDAFSTYIGQKRMYLQLPTGDQAVTWTRSAGSNNYELVDDPMNAAADGDTTYVESSDVEADYYDTGDLTDVSGIIGVVVNAEMKKDDGGATPAGLVLAMKDGGTTTASSADITLTTAYLEYQAIFLTEPGGADWTLAKVNSARIGLSIEGA